MFKKLSAIPNSVKIYLRQYTEILILTISIAILFKFFVFGAYRMPTSAMSPAILRGDFVMGFKLPFEFSFMVSKPIKRGDVVVFQCPDNTVYYCSRRVLGLPGDKLQIKAGKVTINAVPARYEIAQPLSYPVEGAQFLTLYNEFIYGLTQKVYLPNEKLSETKDISIPKDKYFVLSDNRNIIDDSRSYGLVEMPLIRARIFIIWLSVDWSEPKFNQLLPIIRWGRIFKSVD